MKQDMAEKKLIQELQQYTLPEPDPAFKKALKEKFLKKAEQTATRRKWFRRVGVSGTLAASLFIGVWAAQNLPFSGNNQAKPPETNIQQTITQTPPVEESHWKTVNITNPEILYEDYTGQSTLQIGTDQERKKLYAINEGKAVELFESADMEIYSAEFYAFPTEPGKYYVWFIEQKPLEQQNHVKAVQHLMLLEADGSVAEIKRIPQPGINAGRNLQWSPNGERAFFVSENSQGWEVGLLDPSAAEFKTLYGEINQEITDMSAVPDQQMRWAITWASDSTLLLYNPLAQSFYGVNVDEVTAWDYKGAELSLEPGSFVKKIIVPKDQQVAFIRVGAPQMDVSFTGKERLYKLDMQTNELKLVNFTSFNSPEYDQYYLGEMEDGALILGDVHKEKGGFTLSVSAYHPAGDKTTMLFQREFAESLFVNDQVKFSPDQKRIAMRVFAFPQDGGAGAEYLVVVNAESGDKVIDPVKVEFINDFQFVDDHTIKVNEETIPLG